MRGASLLIDGAWVPGGAGTYDILDPADGRVIAEAPDASLSDVDAAVQAADQAAQSWAATPVADRQAVLGRAAGILRSRADAIIDGMTAEMGGLRRDASGAFGAAAAQLEEWANWDPRVFVEPLSPSLSRTPDGERLISGASVRRPHGVVAAITPYNAPLPGTALKIGPALFAGNTVVLKPAAPDPLGVLEVGAALMEAGLPDGVLNIVVGEDPALGASLVSHPSVRMVSFTGSVPVGVTIRKTAADRMTRLLLELGGKGALIAFEDADVDSVVRALEAVWLRFSGQVCSLPTRAILHRSIHDEVVDRLSRRIAGFVVGGASHPNADVGPVISAAHRTRVEGFVESAQADGVDIVRSTRLEGSEAGFFVAPTMLVGCSAGMRAVREEIFGPVLSVLRFDEEEEAVAIANDSDFGLLSYVYTADTARGWRVANRVDSGGVQINTPFRHPDGAVGGRKMSGLGREGGRFAFEAYTEVTAVAWTG